MACQKMRWAAVLKLTFLSHRHSMHHHTERLASSVWAHALSQTATFMVVSCPSMLIQPSLSSVPLTLQSYTPSHFWRHLMGLCPCVCLATVQAVGYWRGSGESHWYARPLMLSPQKEDRLDKTASHINNFSQSKTISKCFLRVRCHQPIIPNSINFM